MAEESRAQKTEEAILKAAFSVINQNSISRTSMRSIAQEAGTALSNLHYRFKSKEDLLLALLKYITRDFDAMRTEVIDGCGDNLSAKLFGFFEQKKDTTINKAEFDRVSIDYWSLAQVNEKVNSSFHSLYGEWRRHIVQIVLFYEPNANREALENLAAMMVSLMMGSTLQYLSDSNSMNLDKYYEGCEKMVMFYLDKYVI